MSNLHLEAIKARAQAATPGPWRVTGEGITNLTPDKAEYGQIAAIVTMHPSDVALLEISDDDSAHIAGMDPETTLALIEEVERLRERQTITNDMIERAALAIAEVDEWPTNEELGGVPTGTRDDEFRDEHIDMARAALEAALGGYE